MFTNLIYFYIFPANKKPTKISEIHLEEKQLNLKNENYD